MQKKSKLLVFLPLILVLVFMFCATSTVAFATSTENNDLIFSVNFPDEQNYVNLNNPTNIAVNNHIAILDTNKIFTNNGNKFSSFEVLDKDISNLQIANNLIGYFYKEDGNINNKFRLFNFIKNSASEVESFENKLNEFLIGKQINNFYLDGDNIYIAYNNTIETLTYTDNTLTKTATLENVNLANLQDFVIVDNVVYFTNGNILYKLENETITKIKDINNTNYTYNDKYIVEFDKTNNKVNIFSINSKISTELTIENIKDIKVYMDKLYIATGNNVIEYLLEDTQNRILYTEQQNFGSKGDYKNKLNTPLATVVEDNKTYILDSGNNKIKDITDKKNIVEYSVDNNTLGFAINDNNIYYFTDNYAKIISLFTSNSTPVEIEESSGIKQIKPFMDTIIALKDNVLLLYNCTNNTFEPIQNANFSSNILNITSNKNSDFIYINDGLNIDKYLLKNNTLQKLEQLSINLSANGFSNTDKIIDFEIDNNGNIYALTADKIAIFKNNGTKYSKAIIKNLVNETYKDTNFVDLALGADTLYFTDKNANLSFFANEQTISKNILDITLEQKPLSKEMSVAKTSKDIVLYTALDSYEKATIIPENSYIWIFNDNNLSSNDKKLVFYFDNNVDTNKKGKLGYIFDNNITNITKTELNKFAKTKSQTTLYMYPYANLDARATVDTLPVNTKVKVLSTTSDYNNGFNWYEVEYNNNIYFVISDDLVFDSETTKIDKDATKINTMITKSSKIGELVKMYIDSSVESDVLQTIKDGELVEIIDEVEGFFKVKYNEKIGYIEKENLIKDGLTNNQMIAIIVSVVTIIVALIIFVCTMIIKNKKKIR